MDSFHYQLESENSDLKGFFFSGHTVWYVGLVSLGGTGRDDISMQFASRDFRPSWEAVKLPLASPGCQGLLD